MSESQFSLLRSPRFLPLFTTQFLGAFNDNVFKNALILLITYHAAEKAGLDARLLVTAAAGIFILPFFLFSATAGQLADKYEKSVMIRRIKLVEIILMITAAIGFHIESVDMLLSVLFLMGAQSTFFGPLKYSILPDHLKRQELIGGNALVEAGTFLAILLGTILGGVLILKPGGVVIISSIVISVALTGWLASRHIPKAGPAVPHLVINHNIVSETWNIIRQTRTNEGVFLSIIGISWFWLVGFVFLAQFPIYGKDVIGGNEDVVTLFLTTFSIGIGAGSLMCNRLLKGEVSGLYAPLGAFGMALSTMALWYFSPETPHDHMITLTEFLSHPSSWPILASMLMISIFGGIYIVPLYTIMQSRCADSHRSRTVAANNIVNAFFMVIGALATMLLLKFNMSVEHIFLSVGLVNLPVALVAHKKFKGG